MSLFSVVDTELFISDRSFQKTGFGLVCLKIRSNSVWIRKENKIIPDPASTLIFYPDSDPDPGSLLHLHLNCRSSKHRKKADFLKPVHFWIRIVDEKYI